MKMTTFVLLHAIGVAVGAAALWWFVFPASLGEAVADAVTAGAVASYVELVAMRLGL
jgi:hypothetical protein